MSGKNLLSCCMVPSNAGTSGIRLLRFPHGMRRYARSVPGTLRLSKEPPVSQDHQLLAESNRDLLPAMENGKAARPAKAHAMRLA